MNTEIWAKFKARVRDQVDGRFYSTYLENLSCRSMTGSEWIVCLPDRATLNIVESSLSDKLIDIIHEVLKEEGIHSDVSLVFSLEGENFEEQKEHEQWCLPLMGMTNKVTDVSTPEEAKAAFKVSPKYAVFDTAAAVKIRENSHLNPNYTFDSFIKGGSNEMAYCAAKAVAANPGGAYNPLFIYGGVGLGKTHLMHAIGNEILQTSNLRVRYMTSEEFTNGFMEALQSGKMPEFRTKVRRDCDVLLLDDIQFIEKKEGTQEEFFNVFNEMTQNSKQIVLTSDRSPKDIKGLTDRMQSRFMQGLMADIQLPEYETR
ncbi:MAG: ATP-binding protein [Proteobacteria bacterium]|nr:ATP-binding protein [Pseudomonadota bacterium]